MDDAVDLNAKVSWNQGEAGSYWFKYRRVGAPSQPWMETVHRPFGPMPNNGGPVTITEKLRPNCEEVENACSQVTSSGGLRTLAPNQSYEYEFCGELTRSSYGQHSPPLPWCRASEPPPPPHDPPAPDPPNDTFTTLPPWGDAEADETLRCPTSFDPPPPPDACYGPPGPTTRSHSDYAFHKSDTAYLQVYFIRPPRAEIWGSFQHGRDLVFGVMPSKAQIWQSAAHFTGPPMRFDFQMKIYRGGAVVDSFRDIVPNSPGFTTGTVQNKAWFVRHRTRGPYRVRYRLTVRAQGRPNPNTADGLWRLIPQTTTPEYFCELNDEGSRICKFDYD